MSQREDDERDDNGFYSKENIISLKNESRSFIIPIKRNYAFIDYEPIRKNDNKKVKFFFFEKRVVWYNAEITKKYSDIPKSAGIHIA